MGKIVLPPPQREGLHWLKEPPEEVLGSPRSGHGDMDGYPPIAGFERTQSFCVNAGGTAEGLPFVPVFGRKGIFIFVNPANHA